MNSVWSCTQGNRWYRKVVITWVTLKVVVHRITDTHYECMVLIEKLPSPHVYARRVDDASYIEQCQSRPFTSLINSAIHALLMMAAFRLTRLEARAGLRETFHSCKLIEPLNYLKCHTL